MVYDVYAQQIVARAIVDDEKEGSFLEVNFLKVNYLGNK